MPKHTLPHGIVSVVQTPFRSDGELDPKSFCRLIGYAIDSGVSGLLLPVAASEVAQLSEAERITMVEMAAQTCARRVGLIVGASSDDAKTCRLYCDLAERTRADANLIAVPDALYSRPEEKILQFFLRATDGIGLPLIIQDLQFHGPGLKIDTMLQLRERLPNLAGFKIETLPAGPKYTAVRKALGEEVYISGGWAVPQLIEALDRGIDAMIPESSMSPVYTAIDQAYRNGDRGRAVRLFWRLLPVLAFSNQDLVTSIAFFKRLLRYKQIFTTDRLRMTGFSWDAHNTVIADELIQHYLSIESDVAGSHNG